MRSVLQQITTWYTDTSSSRKTSVGNCEMNLMSWQQTACCWRFKKKSWKCLSLFKLTVQQHRNHVQCYPVKWLVQLAFLGMCWRVEKREGPFAAGRRLAVGASPPGLVGLQAGGAARRRRHVPKNLAQTEWIFMAERSQRNGIQMISKSNLLV